MSAPGESIPLNPQYLLEALRAASSQSQELVQKASNQLKEWEIQSGYWTLLQDAFLDRSLPVELRWIAIITLKQGVDKYWRKAAARAISKPEKQHIRSRLIQSSIDEPHPQLAVQNAVIVGKVARLEYPLEWPKVFSEITNIIRQASGATETGVLDESTSLRLTRSLSILLHIVKELATGRLSRTKSNLQSITPEVLKILGGVYVKHVAIWQGLLGQQQSTPEQIAQTMMISLLALKIMRRLIVSGYEFPNRTTEVTEAWNIFQDHIWVFFNADSEIAVAEEVKVLLKKHVINIGKLFLDVSDSHPAAFALLPGTLEILARYWNVAVKHGETLAAQGKRTLGGMNSNGDMGESQGQENQLVFEEKVALQGMRLFRACIKMVYHPTSTFKYRQKQEQEEIKNATELFKNQLFTAQAITHYMEILVTKYFILRPSDLEGWEQDPESWNEAWDNSVESWEFMIRPCAEKFFNDLMVNHKDILAEPLMNVFNSVSSIAKDDILIKDAIYTAVGLAAGVLQSSLDFDQFINETLVNEIQVSQPGYNILRRRVAIMVGQWVPVKISVDTRPTVYRVMQHLLNREDPLNDLVVRLTAGHNLRRCIDEWDFRIDAFLPFVDDLFHKLMALIDEVEQTETRMGLLNVIGIIVDRLEHRVTQYADKIVTVLPPLWEQTGEEHLFKQAILSILTKLVTAMKARSLQYHHMVIPLIRFAVEPGSGMQVYLLEDALELWEATIKATPAPASPEILNLFPCLLPCLQLGSATLRRVLDIIESYVLLAPREIVESHRVELFAGFSALLGTLKSESTGIVTHVVEILIRAAKEIGGDSALNTVGTELINSGFLVKVFATLKESYEANLTTGPNRKYAPSVVMLSDYFSLLSRIVTANSAWFLEIVRMIGEREGQSVETVMEWLLEEWFNHVCYTLRLFEERIEEQTLTRLGLKFTNMSHPRQRKLNCLALTKLLETNQRWILKRLQDLMTVWTDVVTELRDDTAHNDSLVYWKTEQEESNEEASPERLRWNELTLSDPVHSVDVTGFIKHHLEKVQNENGGPDAFRNDWVANVDQEVLRDFAKLGLV
ncbi:armadillo-type protein [Geopyxis carbonaria]|nr:armadillo-type protein [Geopyxis carbonaria]